MIWYNSHLLHIVVYTIVYISWFRQTQKCQARFCQFRLFRLWSQAAQGLLWFQLNPMPKLKLYGTCVMLSQEQTVNSKPRPLENTKRTETVNHALLSPSSASQKMLCEDPLKDRATYQPRSARGPMFEWEKQPRAVENGISCLVSARSELYFSSPARVKNWVQVKLVVLCPSMHPVPKKLVNPSPQTKNYEWTTSAGRGATYSTSNGTMPKRWHWHMVSKDLQRTTCRFAQADSDDAIAMENRANNAKPLSQLTCSSAFATRLLMWFLLLAFPCMSHTSTKKTIVPRGLVHTIYLIQHWSTRPFKT